MASAAVGPALPCHPLPSRSSGSGSSNSSRRRAAASCRAPGRSGAPLRPLSRSACSRRTSAASNRRTRLRVVAADVAGGTDAAAATQTVAAPAPAPPGASALTSDPAPAAAPPAAAAVASEPKKWPRGGNIPGTRTDIILMQGFNWESWKQQGGWYPALQAHAAQIAKAGFTDVWLPPPTKSVDNNGYLPSQLYNLDASHFGTEAQLMHLIDAFHGLGVRTMADIVINHRCGDFQDEHGNWTIFEGGTPDDRLDWGPWAITAGDAPYGGAGHADTGADYAAAPDIDHTNPRVQKELSKWLQWLKEDIGFDSWRFDFAKGYGAEFVGIYCENTKPFFAVGEIWTDMKYDGDGQLSADQDEHRQQLVDWVDGTGGRSAAFDFTTKGILQYALEHCQLWRLKDHHGRPSGMLGYWAARSVTFIDNHDTGSTQGHWPFPSDKVMAGYAYILTHPGVPCIFYDHFFDWGLGDKITELVDIRKRNGIHADSHLEIQAAEGDLYVAKIADNVVLKLGSRYDMGSLLPPSDAFHMVTAGTDYAVWERKVEGAEGGHGVASE